MCCCLNTCKVCRIFSFINLILLVLIIIVFLILMSNNPAAQPNILVATAETGDNTQIGNAVITFSQNQIVEGNALSHNPGSNEILINENGIYQISYQLTGVGDEIGRFNFNAILSVNGTPLGDTLNEGPVINASNFNNRQTLTATVILRLNAGDVLQLNGLSQENITYTNARIDIEKIG